MSEKLQDLLKKILEEETFSEIVDNYEKIKTEKIVSSGINSLEYISLLSELDEEYELSDEQIDSLDTMEDLNNVFAKEGDLV
ncbi:MAG: hypothetical protein MSA91_04335 [Lachnobacterium sp.]|nr:hypothetical protein [Lachnobacterium sp.]